MVKHMQNCETRNNNVIMAKHIQNCETRNNNVIAYILLPNCVESDYDVFFNVLKNVVGRVAISKLSENYFDKSVKDAMSEEEIIIDTCDISLNWKNLKSVSEQLWQSKLLGFWSVKYFPSLGKIFYGENWQAPARSSVKIHVENGDQTKSPSEVDLILCQKIKFRLIRLDISMSTLPKLKHFVTVPINDVKVENDCEISQKMRCLDIKQEYFDKCLRALQIGEWLKEEKIRENFTSPLSSSQSLAFDTNATTSTASSTFIGTDIEVPGHITNYPGTRSAKRPRLDVESGTESASQSNLYHSFINLNERSNDAVTQPKNSDSGENTQTNYYTPRLQTLDPSTNLKTEGLNVTDIEIELNLETASLQKIVESMKSTSEKCKHLSSINHMLIIQQKDEEIVQLRRSNEILSSDKSILSKQIIENGDLIRSLQKGIEAMSKVSNRFESDSVVVEQKRSQLEEILAVRDTELQTYKNELDGNTNRIYQLEEILVARDGTLDMIKADLAISKSRINELELISISRESDLAVVEQKRSQLEENLAVRDTELQTYKNELDGNTNRIYQLEEILVARDGTLDMIKADLAISKSRINELELISISRESDLAVVEQKRSQLEENLAVRDTELQTYKNELDGNTNRIYQLEEILVARDGTLDMIKADLAISKSRINELELISISRESDLAVVEQKRSQLEENLAVRDTELQTYKNELDGNTNRIYQLEEILVARDGTLDMIKADLAISKSRISEMELISISRESDLAVVEQKRNELEEILARNREMQQCKDDFQPEETLDDRDGKLEMVKANLNKVTTSKTLTDQNRFRSDDPVVNATREMLISLRFGWIKFTENSRFVPGFKYQEKDSDGINKALKVLSDGYTSSETYKYFKFADNIPDRSKIKSDITVLKKLNRKYGFSFV